MEYNEGQMWRMQAVIRKDVSNKEYDRDEMIGRNESTTKGESATGVAGVVGDSPLSQET